MTSKVPAKSILRQQGTKTAPTLSEEQKAQADRDRRNLGVALYHANKTQHQKNVEAKILSNIEVLLELSAGRYTTTSEASNFVDLVSLFQPSDFDALVEERRIEGKCGYALCSNKPRSTTLGTSAAWKLKAKGAGDYCSNECVRKALYVRTQLSEIPGWEREPGQQPEIVLPDNLNALLQSSESDTAPTTKRLAAADSELALERGENASLSRPKQVMTDAVVERPHVSHDPTLPAYDSAAIEGYVPMQNSKQSPIMVHVESSGYQRSAVEHNTLDHNSGNEEDDAWRAFYENVSKR